MTLHRSLVLSAMMLTLAGAATATPPSVSGQPPATIAGQYQAEGSASIIVVSETSLPFYRLTCEQEGWEGVGVFDGHTYSGVFYVRPRAASASGEVALVTGRHAIDWRDLDHPKVRGSFETVSTGEFAATWKRILVPDSPGAKTDVGPDHPSPGEYIYVDELPEAITKVAPAYPDDARRAGIAGMVIVQTLVLPNGTVGDTKVAKSDSALLNDAAMAAVRQWKFKPAMAKGKAVPVWVTVPVKFAIH